MGNPPRFSGAIPDGYETRMVPLLFRPWAEHVAARAAASGARDVLELAAGTGAGTRALRAALPDAAITATDLSAEMLERAQRTGNAPDVTWQPADAQVLPFADATFDLAVMLFGIMFVPDRAAAYAQLRRVLRPGGTVLLTTWDSIEASPHASALAAAMTELIPDDPPRRLLETAHGHHDEQVLVSELTSAGFEDVRVERLSLPSPTTARDVAQAFLLGSPLRAEIDQRGLAFDDCEPVLEAALVREFGTGTFDMPTPGLLVTAR